jgi:hypothetical protein
VAEASAKKSNHQIKKSKIKSKKPMDACHSHAAVVHNAPACLQQWSKVHAFGYGSRVGLVLQHVPDDAGQARFH